MPCFYAPVVQWLGHGSYTPNITVQVSAGVDLRAFGKTVNPLACHARDNEGSTRNARIFNHNGEKKMSKAKKKSFVNGDERALRFELFHNGLYKQKVIPNKKRKNDRKTWKNKKDNYYSNIFLMCLNNSYLFAPTSCIKYNLLEKI